jgi:uncharacterized protein (UPF0332 family)
MKSINFLNKLKKEGKLKLVDLSEEIKQSYLVKSESNLISAKILLENNRLEEAISLTYYSMYNTLLALLFKTGLKSENHSASIFLLKEIFEFDNSMILFAKRERINTQYYVDFSITEKDVFGLIKKAEVFNESLLNFISKLTNEKINLYRNKFIKMINL